MKSFLTQSFSGKKGLIVLAVVACVLGVLVVAFMRINQMQVENRLVSEVDAIIEAAGLEPIENYTVSGNPSCMDVCFNVKKSIPSNLDENIILSNLNTASYDPVFTNGSTQETYSLKNEYCEASIRFKTDTRDILCVLKESF